MLHPGPIHLTRIIRLLFICVLGLSPLAPQAQINFKIAHLPAGVHERTDGDEKDETQKGEVKDEPQKGDEKDEPQKGDEKDEPQKGDEKDEPQKGDEKDEPQKGDEKDEPQKGDEKDETLEGEEKQKKEAKIIHKGEMTSIPHGNGVSTISYLPEPGTTPPLITITPDKEIPDHGTITFNNSTIPHALLLNQLLENPAEPEVLQHQIASSDVIWVNMPSIYIPGTATSIPPVFATGSVINEGGQLTIYATPVGCTNCQCQCSENDQSPASFCAGCDYFETQEGEEKEGQCACVGCGCPKCGQQDQHKEDGADTTDPESNCSNCKCCGDKGEDEKAKKECRRTQLGPVMIQLTENNTGVASVSINTPEGLTTVVLSEEDIPESAVNTETLTYLITLIGTLAITQSASSSGITPSE